MTVKEQTRAINSLAATADRKRRVADRIRGELASADEEYRMAVKDWRKAMSESGPALLDSPTGTDGEAEAKQAPSEAVKS